MSDFKLTNKKGMSILTSHPKTPSIEKQIEMMADCGFQSVFLSSGTINDFCKIEDYSKIARRCNVELEAVHAPSWGLNDVWELGKDVRDYENEIEKIIEYCNSGYVPKIVLHTVINANNSITEKGLAFFRKIELKAKEYGVRIAYENSVSTEHLEKVLNNSDSYHGFCYDFGHRNCYTSNDDLIQKFSDRLIYTHIHDNFKDGRKDMHLLPFDGDVEWKQELDNLKRINYHGTWNLELSCAHSIEYQQLTFQEFLLKANERLNHLLKVLDLRD